MIDKKRTDESGNIKFTRKQADGTKTELFPLGIYEVRELEAPYGYRKDEEIYEVRLTWDENAKKENKVTSPDVPDNNTDWLLYTSYGIRRKLPVADSAFCAFGEKISEKELTNIIKNMLA